MCCYVTILKERTIISRFREADKWNQGCRLLLILFCGSIKLFYCCSVPIVGASAFASAETWLARVLRPGAAPPRSLGRGCSWWRFGVRWSLSLVRCRPPVARIGFPSPLNAHRSFSSRPLLVPSPLNVHRLVPTCRPTPSRLSAAWVSGDTLALTRGDVTAYGLPMRLRLSPCALAAYGLQSTPLGC